MILQSDGDGTAIDTEVGKRPVYMAVLSEYYGKHIAHEELAPIVGLSLPETKAFFDRFLAGCKPIVESLQPHQRGLTPGELIFTHPRVTSYYDEVKITPIEGFPELCADLQQLTIPIGIVTSAREKLMRELLARSDKPIVVSDVTGLGTLCPAGERAELPKPAPQLFEVSARRLGATQKTVRVGVEDSEVGVEAIKASGGHAIYRPDRRIGPPSERALKIADFVAHDLNEAREYLKDKNYFL